MILNIPRAEIETLTFEYPGDQFDLKFTGADWVVGDEAGEVPADLALVDSMLRVIELLFAEGFATAEETEGLQFDNPTASVRIVTKSGASNPTTRIRVLERDDLSYYVKTPVPEHGVHSEPQSCWTCCWLRARSCRLTTLG